MNIRQMGKLTRHFDAYFGQTDSLVLHPTEDPDPLHIDVLLYPPNAKYPFWKMTLENRSAAYACINQKESYIPPEIRGRSVCIPADIGHILKRLTLLEH